MIPLPKRSISPAFAPMLMMALMLSGAAATLAQEVPVVLALDSSRSLSAAESHATVGLAKELLAGLPAGERRASWFSTTTCAGSPARARRGRRGARRPRPDRPLHGLERRPDRRRARPGERRCAGAPLGRARRELGDHSGGRRPPRQRTRRAPGDGRRRPCRRADAAPSGAADRRPVRWPGRGGRRRESPGGHRDPAQRHCRRSGGEGAQAGLRTASASGHRHRRARQPEPASGRPSASWLLALGAAVAALGIVLGFLLARRRGATPGGESGSSTAAPSRACSGRPPRTLRATERRLESWRRLRDRRHRRSPRSRRHSRSTRSRSRASACAPSSVPRASSRSRSTRLPSSSACRFGLDRAHPGPDRRGRAHGPRTG